jgi:hypothetical protein
VAEEEQVEEMKKETIICDICGKELNIYQEGYYQYTHNNVPRNRDYDMDSGIMFVGMGSGQGKWDVCEECEKEQVWPNFCEATKKKSKS